MSYIGRGLQSGAFRQLDDISSGFDGSDTTHTMQVNSTNVTVGDVNQILLSLGGVIQKPGTDFTVSSSVLTFTTAPAANTSFFAILLGSDNGGTTTPTDGSVTTGKIVDDAVTAAKVASSGAFAIGAAGTASSLAGVSFYKADNSIYTHDVSGTDSTAEFNTAFGVNALDAITTGDKNIAIGYNAGTAVTEAVGNVLIGEAAGAALTTGGSNTLIGRLAGDAFDTEANNIAIGVAALGGSVAGGEYNVAVGNYTLDALTSGDNNTAVGYNALTADTAGNQSVAIGYGALAAQNFTSSTATENVAVGYNAGTSNTTGDYNTFIGGNAGTGVTTGAQNTLIGRYAGGNFDTENHNLAIGRNALGGSVAGGEYNVAIGNLSLDAVTSADYCTAVGYEAGTNIAASDGQNTLMGYQAGTVITTGGYNTIIGSQADTGQNDANYNTLVGVLATGSGNGHQIVMGYNNGSAGNNYVTLGQGSGGDKIYANYTSSATWTKASDERIKKDIVTNTEIGLDFINELRTVKFKKKNHSEVDANLAIYDASDTDARDDIHYGLIAQEVKAAMDKHSVAEFKGWHKLSKEVSPDEIQGVSEQMFVYPLIKAVQELAAKVKTLEEA